MKYIETHREQCKPEQKRELPFLHLLDHEQFTIMLSRTVLGRHGITEFNADGLLQGSSDLPLSEAGIVEMQLEASQLANTAHGITSILSSNMLRAIQTADIFSEKLGGISKLTTPLLQEYGSGVWEGRKIAELITTDPHHNKWTVEPVTGSLSGIPERGESFILFLQRISISLHLLNDHIAQKPHGDNDRVLLISHATANRAIRFLSMLSRKEGTNITISMAQKHERSFFFQDNDKFIKIPHGIFQMNPEDDTLEKIQF